MNTSTHPFSPHFSEHYWSGGPSEKTHVYLHGNALPERFAEAESFTVAELGFGTGLTFLLTAQLWKNTAASDLSLTYIGYELHPLSRTELATIHTAFPHGLHALSDAFLSVYNPQPGWNTLTLGNVTLHLYMGDATIGLASHPVPADSWFLDGFSPANNPQLWTADIFTRVAAHTKSHGTATTYTVARAVRENLIAAGFHIEKVRGHPPKDHMLKATKI